MADLYQVYGLDLQSAMAGGMEPPTVAALCAQLPPGSRVWVAEDSDYWWTGERVLLAALLNDLRGLIWGMSDRKKRGAPPKPIGPSSMTRGRSRTLAAVAMSKSDLLAELAKPRKEAADG